MTKGYDPMWKYRDTPTAQKQTQSIADYLINEKKVPRERLVARGIYCGKLLVTEEDLQNAKQKKKDVTIRTNIQILSIGDYIPK